MKIIYILFFKVHFMLLKVIYFFNCVRFHYGWFFTSSTELSKVILVEEKKYIILAIRQVLFWYDLSKRVFSISACVFLWRPLCSMREGRFVLPLAQNELMVALFILHILNSKLIEVLLPMVVYLV